MPASPFDDLTDFYEAMIDWPQRLAHEGPFYRRLFEQIGARRVLDAACGTGRHAAMFHEWGLRVEAADVAPAMIERARRRCGEPRGLCWVVRGFEQPVEAGEPFDAALCVGNSLALAPDEAAARRAIGQVLAAVRPGGVVVVHLMNLWRLPDGPCTWQKCLRAALPQGEVLILKGVHRSGSRGYVDLFVARLPEGTQLHSESVPLLGLTAADLESAAREAGATQVVFHGGYQGEPYRAEQSVDLLMVAVK